MATWCSWVQRCSAPSPRIRSDGHVARRSTHGIAAGRPLLLVRPLGATLSQSLMPKVNLRFGDISIRTGVGDMMSPTSRPASRCGLARLAVRVESRDSRLRLVTSLTRPKRTIYHLRRGFQAPGHASQSTVNRACHQGTQVHTYGPPCAGDLSLDRVITCSPARNYHRPNAKGST
jgi:hypothetical protein